MSAKDRMLDHLKKKKGKYVSVHELGKIAGIVDFTRGLRLLRQEGWDLEWKWDNGTTWYRLNSLKKRSTGKKRTQIDAKTRYRILQRDNSTCQRCGRTVADGIKLDIDHKIPVDWGGSNDDNNLWSLCQECDIGKQAFFSDFDSETMKTISNLPSGSTRLQEFIRRNYGKPIPVYLLQIISKTRDWTRELRRLRQDGHFDYRINRKDWTYTFRAKSLKPARALKKRHLLTE
jgi:5-methylcytosine-specific restriction endonuclease McrA